LSLQLPSRATGKMHPIYLQHAERRPGCVRGRLGTRPGHLDSACRVSVRPCKMQQSSNSCSFVRRSSICSALPHLARNLCLLDESVCAWPGSQLPTEPPLPLSSAHCQHLCRKRQHCTPITPQTRNGSSPAPHCTARRCHLRGASGNSACRATLRRAVDRSAAPLALGARRCAIPVSAPCLTCQMQRGSHPDANQRSQVSPWR
jgi:hypothetical protein